MRRIVSALGKLNWGSTPCALLLLCAAMAIALPAQTFTLLTTFNGHDGGDPLGALVQGASGYLYGTASFGGTGYGTVFKITPSGNLSTLYSFSAQAGCNDGADPQAGLVQAANGDLYGTTLRGGTGSYAGSNGTVFKITPSGALTTLYSFCPQSGCTDGKIPQAGLVQATNGDLYGTTQGGGAIDACGEEGC